MFIPAPLAVAIGIEGGEEVEWELLSRNELHLVRRGAPKPSTRRRAVDDGWEKSGQSLTVPVSDTTFDSFTFFVDSVSNGKTFDLSIESALNDGSILWSSSLTVSTGANLADINQSFTEGSTIFFLIDYRGFYGKTVHFTKSDP